MTQRTRNRSKGPFSEPIYWQSNNNTPILIGEPDLYYLAENFTDVVTPAYHEKISRGEIINNPCSYSKTQMESSGDYSAQHVRNQYQTLHIFGGSVTNQYVPLADIPDNISYPDTDQLKSSAKLAAIANMDKTQFAFGEDIGELGQTLRFLKNPLKSLSDLSRDYKQYLYSKKRSGVRAAQASADAYATVQWAAKPLLRSAEDLVFAALTQTEALSKGFRSSSRGFAKDENKESVNGHIDGSRIYDYSRSKSLDVHATILYENFREDNALLRKYGLRLKDFPETAWQLVPLSFMVDRVTNISQSISAIQNILDPNLSILAASVTTRRTNKSNRKIKQFVQYNDTWTVAGDDVENTTFSYIRETWSPSLSDTVPPVIPGNIVKDFNSILDLAAITIQHFTNK